MTTSSVPVVQARNLSKRFGATQALFDVSLEVSPGEVRALVGRNGAGKSTLVSLLTGMVTADSGSIQFSGNPAPAQQARELWQGRVACVYQRPKVVPTMSCAENLLLGENMQGRKIISWRAMGRRAEQVFDQWGLDIDVKASAGELGTGQRQLLEIARALIQGSRFVILDEPTAKLDGPEVERLFTHIRGLQSRGVGVLFISHHLDEIFEICESVTVLRDGRKILDQPLPGLVRSDVLKAMVGSTLVPASDDTKALRDCSASPVRLEVQGLCSRGCFEEVTFQVRAGECLGIAGLAGSGKEGLGEALAGLRPFDAGHVRLDGAELPGGDVARHNRLGIGFVPQDRHREGLVSDLSIAENCAMTIQDKLGPLGFIRPGTLEGFAQCMIAVLGIKASGPAQPVSALSGGNQQKVVLGRALARGPSALVLINPTSGVDVASKAALFASIDKVAERGTAVVLISDELEELDICDRVLVIRSRRLTREFKRPLSAMEVIAAMEGIAE